MIFSRYLDSFSIESESVSSGAEAIKNIEEKPYDLVIMDWKMPEMNGMDCIRRVQALPNLEKMPKFILVSAYGREELRDEAQHMGVETYLVKPVNPSILFDGILEVFGEEIEHTTGIHMIESVGSFKGYSVLLVEDNEINQQVAEEILSDKGFEVTIANDGQEGVNTLFKSPNAFDLVLMDIQMPIMDGYKATKTIRRDERFKKLPIVAMTANAMAGDREKALGAGMNDHVAKPIDVKNLFEVLSKYVRPIEKEEQENRPAPKENHEWPEVPGIDFKEGLYRVGGKSELYRKILKKFSESQSDFFKELQIYLDNGDRESAVRLAHTLKGLAGNVGAKLDGSSQRFGVPT